MSHLTDLDNDPRIITDSEGPRRASVPLGSECLIRVHFLDSAEEHQQLVLASTIPIERIQSRQVEIRNAVEALLCSLGLQPLSIQLETINARPLPFTPPRESADLIEFPIQRRLGTHTAG